VDKHAAKVGPEAGFHKGAHLVGQRAAAPSAGDQALLQVAAGLETTRWVLSFGFRLKRFFLLLALHQWLHLGEFFFFLVLELN
jgi:hypothetical protein